MKADGRVAMMADMRVAWKVAMMAGVMAVYLVGMLVERWERWGWMMVEQMATSTVDRKAGAKVAWTAVNLVAD